MKKRVKGMTLIEMIISLSILTIIIGVIYSFFFSSNRILSDADINEELQSDAQRIEYRLSKDGMESSNICDIIDIGKNNIIDNNSGEVRALKIKRLDTESTESYILFKYIKDKSSLYYKPTATIPGDKIEMENDDVSGFTLLSSNVENFKIDSTEIDNSVRPSKVKSFKDTKSIQVTLILSKKSGYSDVTRKVSTVIKFRN